MQQNVTLIVGAGPTGLTLAIELARAGLPVRLIDKSDHPAQYSQALVVQARTLEQFERYGIAAAAVARGRKLLRANFYSEGKRILSFDLGRIPGRYPYVLFLPQSATEQLLGDHLASLGVRPERGIELTALSDRGTAMTATLRHSDGSPEEVDVRWVAGCDGAHSEVRSLTGIAFEGSAVRLSFLLADLEIEGPDAIGDELAVHVRGGDLVFMGRLTERWTRVIVALHEQQDQPASDAALTVEDFQSALDHLQVRAKVRNSAWMTPFHVNDRQAARYREGSAFLAGDAAHIHSPVGGQGMNTGIQDAANLGWKLAAVARGADPQLLDSYDEERSEVGRALLRSTSRVLAMATTSNPLIEGLRNALLPVLSSISRVQDALVGFVSETAIEYRRSSAVADGGGDGTLRAGDRMPDLDLAADGGYHPDSLLSGWRGGRHLALLLNGTAAEQIEWQTLLRHAKLSALSSPGVSEAARTALGIEKKMLIVRPDGYLGWRGPLDDPRLGPYVRREALI